PTAGVSRTAARARTRTGWCSSGSLVAREPSVQGTSAEFSAGTDCATVQQRPDPPLLGMAGSPTRNRPMKLPAASGLTRRLILVNFRVRPAVIQALLPAPFQPKLVRGSAIAGVCLIRLEQVRPRFLPPSMGFHSENAAHRVAVCWTDEAGEP